VLITRQRQTFLLTAPLVSRTIRFRESCRGKDYYGVAE